LKYVIRTVLGMGLFAFCWAVIAYAIYQLLQTGTCASGGPYVVARECPDGLGWVMFSMIGAIAGLFVALFIYAGRGAPPGSDHPPGNPGLIVWFWTGLFWSLAVGCFLGVWGPEASPGPGGKEGGLIVGFMGLIFGAAGIWVTQAGWTDVRHRRKKIRPGMTKVAETASRFSGRADPGDRIATLDRLRRQGTITDAEFETLKAKIVSEL
jgi:hypothetical protein